MDKRRQAHDSSVGAIAVTVLVLVQLGVILRFRVRMSPINMEVIVRQQLHESTRVLDVIVAALLGAAAAIAALTGAAVYLGWWR